MGKKQDAKPYKSRLFSISSEIFGPDMKSQPYENARTYPKYSLYKWLSIIEPLLLRFD